MSTLLITVQIVCYALGIVSASLNIASFVRGWRAFEDPVDWPDPTGWQLPVPPDEPGSWRL